MILKKKKKKKKAKVMRNKSSNRGIFRVLSRVTKSINNVKNGGWVGGGGGVKEVKR